MLEVLLYPQANAYIDDVTNRFQLICRERNEYSTAVRIYHHAHHLIVYVFTDSELRVVRILYESMEVGAQLDQDDLDQM